MAINFQPWELQYHIISSSSPSINSRFALTFLMIPGGVDVLGTLSEKLKQLTNEAKDHHSSFTDLTKLYKEDKINEKDFFSKVLNYVVTSSALTFLLVRVISIKPNPPVPLTTT